jgi:hypothetical protein
VCNSNSSGKYCEKLKCPEINPCLNDGKCIAKTNRIKCKCQEGFSGNICQFDEANIIKDSRQSLILTNTCEINKNICKNNGQCLDTLNGYKCECTPNYTGRNCENIGKYNF